LLEGSQASPAWPSDKSMKTETVIRELSQILDDEDRFGSRNVGLLAIQLPHAAASPRIYF
jgi:hypothetical protein